MIVQGLVSSSQYSVFKNLKSWIDNLSFTLAHVLINRYILFASKMRKCLFCDSYRSHSTTTSLSIVSIIAWFYQNIITYKHASFRRKHGCDSWMNFIFELIVCLFLKWQKVFSNIFWLLFCGRFVRFFECFFLISTKSIYKIFVCFFTFCFRESLCFVCLFFLSADCATFFLDDIYDGDNS